MHMSSQNQGNPGSKKFGAILWLIAITSVYLVFELAFNSRLLDAVGGGATPDEIEQLEIFGRTLSGIAVGLVVLQVLMGRQAFVSGSGKVGLVVLCLLSGIATAIGIKLVVDSLVSRSSGEFRRDASNIVLIQKLLIQGRAELDGVGDSRAVFSSPEGRSFLAVLPGLATMTGGLEDLIKDERAEFLRNEVIRSYPNVRLEKDLQRITGELKKEWEKMNSLKAGGLDVDPGKLVDKKWGDYLIKLGKRGWTPSTIPSAYTGTVVSETRKQLPCLPKYWDPADESTFRQCVESEVQRKQKSVENKQIIRNGHVIPRNTNFDQFFASEGVQIGIRKELKITAPVRFKADYGNSRQFMSDAYYPVVNALAAEEIKRLVANPQAFERGGKFEKEGLEAARAAIVPPVALLFSLMGGIGHFGKLIYLVCALAAGLAFFKRGGVPKGLRWFLIAVPFLVIGASVFLLSRQENAVTTSEVYGSLREKVEKAAILDEGNRGGALTGLMLKSLHIVAVGQGIAYPMNEGIRTQVLNGITFGYHE